MCAIFRLDSADTLSDESLFSSRLMTQKVTVCRHRRREQNRLFAFQASGIHGVFDFLPWCDMLHIDSAGGSVVMKAYPHHALPRKGTVAASTGTHEQNRLFAFPVSAIDAIDNGLEWGSFYGNTDHPTPGCESSELVQGIAIVMGASGETNPVMNRIAPLCGISHRADVYLCDGSWSKSSAISPLGEL